MARKRSAEHIKAQKAGRKRDGNICQICGSTEHTEGHHIIDYQFDGAAVADNIITFCHRHHKDVHSGKIDILKF